MVRESRIWHKNSVYTPDKREFLSIYTSIHGRAFSKANILSGFAAAGLIPFKPERVLAKLHIEMKTPTPPSSSSSNQSFYLGSTPAKLYQLNQQKKQIQELQNQSLSSVVAEQMLEKFMKSTKVAMQDAVLLKQELHQLRTSYKHQKEKKMMTRALFKMEGV